LVKYSKDEYFFILNKSIYYYKNGENLKIGELSGSRPLSFLLKNDVLYYGEYINNKNRNPVNIWYYNIKSKDPEWKSLVSLDNVRHIHGVYSNDSFKDIWITTGDLDFESCIFKFDQNKGTLEKVVSGSQYTRTIKLLFNNNSIFYGTDTPLKKNFICRLDLVKTEVKYLKEVGSSIFHGINCNGWYFFSTAIEPSKINSTKFCEVWASQNGEEWKCILKAKKDKLSMKYFQYGQITFPVYKSERNQFLYLNFFATKLDGCHLKLSFSEVHTLYENSDTLIYE